MKKGFTLLELIVVIIIIGVLATLGFAQYTRMIERARGAEAKAVLGAIRTQLAGLYMENNNVLPDPAGGLNPLVGIGVDAGMISSDCAGVSGANYLFSYGVARTNDNQFVATGTRCTVGGKSPVGPSAGTLTLTTNLSTGIDTWGGTGGY